MSEDIFWKASEFDFISDLKPDNKITFSGLSKVVGTLDFSGPAITFDGNADESAKVFFETLSNVFAERLEQERGGAVVQASDVPDGYVLVPENPTDEMYEAATDRSWYMAGRVPCGHHDLVSAIWVAMINEAKKNGEVE